MSLFSSKDPIQAGQTYQKKINAITAIGVNMNGRINVYHSICDGVIGTPRKKEGDNDVLIVLHALCVVD